MDGGITSNAFTALCPICDQKQRFEAPDDFLHCRKDLIAAACPLHHCITRERALAATLWTLIPRERVKTLDIHEPAPAARSLSRWFRESVPGYVATGFHPDAAPGAMVGGLRNENLERQSFADASFDLVVHLDVLEHVFEPFQALREIARTLRPGGLCLFCAPTYAGRQASEQVAFAEPSGLRIVGEPEYHGNPQRPGDGALVTWRYGYDLPLLIQRQTGFDVEVRRFQSRAATAMGPMTEVYILQKQHAEP